MMICELSDRTVQTSNTQIELCRPSSKLLKVECAVLKWGGGGGAYLNRKGSAFAQKRQDHCLLQRYNL